MSNRSTATTGLWEELHEAFQTIRLRGFLVKPLDKPFVDHWKAVGERTAQLVFGMAFLPIAVFRVRNHLLRHNVPLLPYLCDLLSAAVWHVFIGRYVEIGRGLVIPHGHVVMDGKVEIGRNCAINPWVTIGLSNSRRVGFSFQGPRIGDDVFIGTGAKVLGPVTIGDGARIGANAVVIDDVPPGATVVGVPARVVHNAPPDWESLVQAGPS